MHIIDVKKVKTIQAKVLKELQSAARMHPDFQSKHEAYAVILEEFEEFWDELKKRMPDKNKLHDEMIQVSAMTIKYLLRFHS